MGKKIFFSLLILLFGFGLMAKLSPVKADDPLVILDEFVANPSSGNQEWIELLNPSQTSALDLTGWRLVVHQGPEEGYTYYYSQDLSGSVPRGGFLTFATDNDARLPDEGACIVIFISDTESVNAVKYGTGTCDVGADEQDATGVSIEQGKSIYFNLDEQTWNSGDPPTRGWCNPGSGDCPTISTITTQMSNENVATNLGDQTDFSRISGLYFQKSEGGQNIGKITFLAEMNFTDRDALTWMQSLDTKLDISQGIISLDADLIKNLTDTQASLTMYNITLNNPKILVNGQEDTGGIVSGLIYNQTNHTLTFTAAHFTTFTAAENTSSPSSSSTGSSTSTPNCGDFPPNSSPNLFQIDTTNNSATLYFTPVNPVSKYFIAYGLSAGDERYGVEYDQGVYGGVLSYTVKALSPNTTYYFKVRGGNGCAPGKWSNNLLVKTEDAFTTEIVSKEISEKISPTPEISQKPEPTLSQQKKINVTNSQNEIKNNLSFWQKIRKFFKNLFY